MGLRDVQKDRLVLNQPPYVTSATTSVYQTPSQRWEEEHGLLDPMAPNLKQSRSDVKFPRDQPDFEGYDRFQLPVSEQYQRRNVGVNNNNNQPRALPMHSNKPTQYNAGITKPPSIVSEFSVKFPMDAFRQNRIATGYTGTNQPLAYEDATGYLNNRPTGMTPLIYNGNREFTADSISGTRRDPPILDGGYKIPRYQHDMLQRNVPDYVQQGSGNGHDDRNQIPKFPKDMYNAGGVKKRPM